MQCRPQWRQHVPLARCPEHRRCVGTNWYRHRNLCTCRPLPPTTPNFRYAPCRDDGPDSPLPKARPYRVPRQSILDRREGKAKDSMCRLRHRSYVLRFVSKSTRVEDISDIQLFLQCLLKGKQRCVPSRNMLTNCVTYNLGSLTMHAISQTDPASVPANPH